MALAETLIDDFESGGIDTGLWTVTSFVGTVNAAVTVVEAGGVVTITPVGNPTPAAGWNGLRSVANYDLTGSYIEIDAQQVTTNNTETALYAFISGNNYLRIVKNFGNLHFQSRLSAVTTDAGTTIGYNATTHRWWRIRHQTSDDTIKWETSPDGSPGSWTERGTLARSSSIAITALAIGFQAGTNSTTEGAPGIAIITLFNRPLGPVPQVARPNTDVVVDNWQTHTGATTGLAATLVDPSDANYIRTVPTPTSDVYVTGPLVWDAAFTDPETSANHLVRWRYGKDLSVGEAVDLTIQLRQGYVNEGSPGTLIATVATLTNIAAFPVAGTYTLSGSEANAITNYNSLYCRFLGNKP